MFLEVIMIVQLTVFLVIHSESKFIIRGTLEKSLRRTIGNLPKLSLGHKKVSNREAITSRDLEENLTTTGSKETLATERHYSVSKFKMDIADSNKEDKEVGYIS